MARVQHCEEDLVSQQIEQLRLNHEQMNSALLKQQLSRQRWKSRKHF